MEWKQLLISGLDVFILFDFKDNLTDSTVRNNGETIDIYLTYWIRPSVPARSLGQSYKANFGINYIKNGLKLNFTLNYINFDVFLLGPSLSYIRAPRELRDVGICLLDKGLRPGH